MLKSILKLGSAMLVLTIAFKLREAFALLVHFVPETRSWEPLLPNAQLALVLMAFAIATYSLVRDGLTWLYYRFLGKVLRDTRCLPCKEDDVPELHRIAALTLDNILPLEKTRELYRYNRQGFLKIVDLKSGQIRGYFCVLPLTNRGRDDILAGTLTVDTISLEHFAKSKFPSKRPVYLGSLAGLDWRSRAACLHFLRDKLREKKVSTVYTRPITEDGLRLVKKHGFRPVGTHDTPALNVFMMREVGRFAEVAA